MMENQNSKDDSDFEMFDAEMQQEGRTGNQPIANHEATPAIEPSNLGPRDLLLFGSEEDQQLYEKLFYESANEINPAEICSLEIAAPFSPDEGGYKIIALGIQCVTSVESAPNEQSVAVVEDALCVHQLAPTQPFVASLGEGKEIDHSTASIGNVLSVAYAMLAEGEPYEMW